VLFLAAGVGEAEVHEPHAFFGDEIQDVFAILGGHVGAPKEVSGDAYV
jgi:hypothetical protein